MSIEKPNLTENPKVERSKIIMQAQELVQELENVNFQKGHEDPSGKNKLPEVNKKMKELLEIITKIYGDKVEKRVGDNEIISFLAADKLLEEVSNRCYLIVNKEETEDGEEKVKSSSLHFDDGGSLLGRAEGPDMDLELRDDEVARLLEEGWTKDEQYDEDLKYIEEKRCFGDFAKIGANRFREMRTTTNMIEKLLATENIEDQDKN